MKKCKACGLCDLFSESNDYKNPEKIGFIGGRDMIEYSLIFLLDSSEKYVNGVLLSDLMPYARQSNFKRGYQNRSRRDFNAK